MKVKKTVTHAKLEANQKNATKSTGPKTTAGKANTRNNAMKHGLTARNLVFASDGKPADEQLATLQEALRLQYPQNVLAEILIDNVVVDCWRQRQGLNFEKRHLSQSVNPFYALGEMSNIMRYNHANRRALVKNLEMLEKLRADQPDILEELKETTEKCQSNRDTVANSLNPVETETASANNAELPTSTDGHYPPNSIESMDGAELETQGTRVGLLETTEMSEETPTPDTSREDREGVS